MVNGSSLKPSFSRGQKWGIAFHVAVAVLAVLAVVVMVNYLGGRYSKRFFTSAHYQYQLSPRTLSVLNSLTNPVQVTLYYQRSDPYYAMLVDLLTEYQRRSSKISLQAVDYIRDTGPAQEAKTNYNLGAATNLVIFAVEGRPARIVVGEELVERKMERMKSERPDELAYAKRDIGFNAESKFTGALLAVSNPKPVKAYYLMGDGEHPVDESDDSFRPFLLTVQEQYIQLAPLLLSGTNVVPMDCNLLIIAGPTDPMTPTALERIDHYLNEGGRLFALFNINSVNREIGLEKILANWGVGVGNTQVIDPDLTSRETPGSDVLVLNFSGHPAVNPLIGRTVRLLQPRPIRKLDLPSPAADERKAVEIAVAGPRAYTAATTNTPEMNLPLMVAVEQTAAKGIPLHERGATRIFVVGDSRFLTKLHLDEGANRAFGSFAVNWLVERNLLLEVGSQPIVSYRILLTVDQARNMQWILLAGVPGAVLLFGGLVWLRRRK